MYVYLTPKWKKNYLGGTKGTNGGSRQRGRKAQSTFYISIKRPSETQHHHNEHLLIKIFLNKRSEKDTKQDDQKFMSYQF